MKDMIRNYSLLLVCVMSLLLAGCGSGSSGGVTANSDTTGTVNARPGTLAMSQMNGLSKVAFKNLTSTTTTTFDLGTIKASRDFYFILNNSGDVPVTNVVITSLNSNFSVSPSNIDSINPQKDNYLTPVLRVSAKHGIALDGTGYTSSLLPMGNNTCTLRITGKTKDNNNGIDIVLNVTLKVYTEIMDISLIDNVTELYLASPDTTWTTKFGSDIPGYKCLQPAIKNTGNIDIVITNTNNDWTNNYPVLEQFTLHPNETKGLAFPAIVGSGSKSVTIKLNSNNTIADYSKLRLKPDGSVFIMLQSF